MSVKQRKLLWTLIIAVTVISTGLFWASARTKIADTVTGSIVAAPLTLPTPRSGATPRTGLRSRLARQPQVSKLRRILGHRLNGKRKATSMLIGVLTIGTDERIVRIIRHQADDGEAVEIIFGNQSTPLRWSAAQGAISPGHTLTDNEQLIVERLTLDSPDQFVLAQLRGASYYTVAHNVRPEEAGGSDNYTGPTWDVVRVDESSVLNKQSSWRLYYINTATGLIDKIISPDQEETVVAELSGWTEAGGEKVPSKITWSRRGQVVMQYRLANFSYSNQQ